MTIDDRAFVMQAVMTMDVPSSLAYFYPRLIPLHDINPDQESLEIPSPIRCTIEKMSDQGVYVLGKSINLLTAGIITYCNYRKWHPHVSVDWAKCRSRIHSTGVWCTISCSG